jgi:hypothetical protein
VIKKLKTINDEQKDVLMDELKSVNLSKFVSEAVSYICEAKLRSADIQAAVQVIDLTNLYSPQYISKINRSHVSYSSFCALARYFVCWTCLFQASGLQNKAFSLLWCDPLHIMLL